MSHRRAPQGLARRCALRVLQALLGLSALIAGAGTLAKPSDWAEVILQERRDGALRPIVSYYEDSLDRELAYDIQRAYVEKLLGGGRIAGYKAALTSRLLQTQHRIASPVAGALLGEDGIADGSIVRLREYKRLVIEAGFALRVNATLNRPLRDVEMLKRYVDAVLPVVELVDIGFENQGRLSSLDLIAVNACAGKFILGAPLPPDQFDLNGQLVTVEEGGRAVSWGKGVEAMGDQWNAALWLANEMIGQGWTLEAGQILYTGALGRSVAGKLGEYQVDFGPAGRLKFEVR